MKKFILFAIAMLFIAGCMTPAQKNAILATAELQVLTTHRAVKALETIPNTDQNKIDALAGNQQLLRSMETLVQSAQLSDEAEESVIRAIQAAMELIKIEVLKANITE